MLAPGIVLFALSAPAAPAAAPVSLIQLIATPERYEAERVKVTGTLWLRPSAAYLFPSAEARRYFLTESAITLDTPRPPDALARLDGRWVTLTGVFHARPSGGILLAPSQVIPAVDYEVSPMASPYDWRAALLAALTALLLLVVLGLLALRLRRR